MIAADRITGLDKQDIEIRSLASERQRDQSSRKPSAQYCDIASVRLHHPVAIHCRGTGSNGERFFPCQRIAHDAIQVRMARTPLSPRKDTAVVGNQCVRIPSPAR